MTKALVVIDIQEGLIDLKPYKQTEFITNVKKIINHFRQTNLPVIFFRHTEAEGLLKKESANWQVYHELAPASNEVIFNKHYNSIFKDTDFKEYLKQQGITELTFVGMQAEFCIDVSTKVAFELGYPLTLVEDAISTFDNDYLSAEQILDFYTNYIWRDRFATLKTTKNLIK
ncbi:cysteine hydrolase family protein [Ligilactobacillus agilis]|uniref:cysteine hydrolase family protein n=1 Tax=Ligilactobacillus agilis TaxID=1601 RepID=UPI00255C7A77|nr:cysteine hydrolase family protein [Ligilactobacillus agilis]